ncbi:MAG: hypothetical protein LQ352_004474 [Teloschistes flavicans]|nr:MAG: hypothetical protein LQ352_004474 [Teloschistes flavicans]
MRGTTPILKLLFTFLILSQADCAPAAARDALPIAIPSAVAPGPPGASGSLYGSQSLEGPDGNPVDPADSAEVNDYQLVPGQTEDQDLGLYLDLESVPNPQPIRGTGGGTDGGPRNMLYEKLNPDLYAPPGTDAGDFGNSKWPMGLSYNRQGLDRAGFARQQNVEQLPIATQMAGVDMKLSPHAYRELHWHQANEWAYVFNGSVRVGAVDENGQTTYDDLNAGDVWFFPSGKPHTLQALDQGTEFLLIFDSGTFSEDNTFLATELFLRTPKSVLAKDLRTDISAFENLPKSELYIFPGTPAPANLSAQNITGPAGSITSNPYTYHFSQQDPYVVPGGSVKIIDPTTFPIAFNFSVALVVVQPGAMREIHWHTDSDEWNFFISGNARTTVFSAPSASRTFDFAAGDVGYVPFPDTHYIENTGDVDVVYLEVLQAPKFTDISVSQWLGLTPPQVVKDTLHLPDELVARLPKYKSYIVPGHTNLTDPNYGP